MLENLKKEVFEANLELVKHNLVIFTWGNVSGIDRKNNLIVIKPSGVSYDEMTENDMVVVDFDGNVVEGNLKPSSDTQTHIELYKKYDEIGGIVHTHSTWATGWAQAKLDIVPLGTTHSDYFYGDIPCTRELTKNEVEYDYEKNTGLVILEELEKRNIQPLSVPGILVASHGPFSWGKDAKNAVYNAVVLEEVAKINFISKSLNPNVSNINDYILDKHYLRKHGENAYYGQ
ncbi:L-ribulose-5-phosphate 4-epimerase [Romboutsia sp. CE17]|uniref:L-ribulose-5-phosphate 4-epimerase n=1 Tax=Romboutsia sp. CE17 TaxID=2724150 RepID=UPI001442CCDA|nr:L-ribulose-5-phosphate 4-epimerase [Romboutsia sp. CE17]QJA09031.1 L-ribulose-5-phosphate 4-epimerase [Romboutsia sp. CE17]